MKSGLGLLCVAIAGAVAGSARAGDGHFRFGVTGGTLGVGPEIAWRIGKAAALRANATYLSLAPNFQSDGIDYDGDVELQSGGLMLDLHPFGGGLHVSGGARINANEADVAATPAGNVTINGFTYTPAQVGTISGAAATRDFAPMASIGYSGGLKRGLTFGFEAGALFQGAIEIEELIASGGLVSAIDLGAERQSLQDDVNDYKIYPVLQLRLGYRF